MPLVRKSKGTTEKELEKAAKKAETERIRAERKEQKEREKEAKAREKERIKRKKELAKRAQDEAKKAQVAYNDANKLRTKQTAALEMTVHVDPSFCDDPAGSRVLTRLLDLHVKIARTVPQVHPRALTWTRTVRRVWSQAKGCWEPCAIEREEREGWVLVRLSAVELSALVMEDGCGVEVWMASVRSSYEGAKPIVLLEGLKEAMKLRNRRLDAQIREGMRGGRGRGRGTAAATAGEVIVSKEEIEANLLWLQMCGDCYVQFAESLDEVVDLIVSFTTTIAMIPERRTRSEQFMRVKFGDTVKSGASLQDCWRRVLMEVKPCTESVANAIIKAYPTYRSLMDAYARMPTEASRVTLLENLDVERVGSTKRMGPAMARKICLALTSEDVNLAVFDPPPARKAHGGAPGGTGRGGGAGRGANPFRDGGHARFGAFQRSGGNTFGWGT
ncbi:hypothetical protein BC830DRAFT_648426 [Chytriomyces sp. MP71]|nr:hypothetical protein BC830DRAFT_648426 [Chytriomyces sp. MP71]